MFISPRIFVLSRKRFNISFDYKFQRNSSNVNGVICRRYVDFRDYAKLHSARDYVHLLSPCLFGPRNAKEDRTLETIHYGITNGTFPFSIWLHYLARCIQRGMHIYSRAARCADWIAVPGALFAHFTVHAAYRVIVKLHFVARRIFQKQNCYWRLAAVPWTRGKVN